MSRQVEVDNLVLGDVLDADVLNAQGMTLLKTGVVIEERHKKILKQWGVKKVDVRDAQDTEAESRPIAEILAEKEREIGDQLTKVFSACSGNELMMELKELVMLTRIEQARRQLENGKH